MNTDVLTEKQAIQELIARYNHAIDSLRMDDWLDCWTDDAVMDGIGQYLVGKAAIKVFADGYAQNYASKMPGGRHFTVNIVSNVVGDHATSHSYLQLWSTQANGPQMAFTGVYEDVLVKQDGRWRFKGRKITRDKPPKA